MNDHTTAAQPLDLDNRDPDIFSAADLDEIEAIAAAAPKCWYGTYQIVDGISDEKAVALIEACSPDTVLTLIAQARAAQPESTAPSDVNQCDGCPASTPEASQQADTLPVVLELPDGDHRTARVVWSEVKNGKRHLCIVVSEASKQAAAMEAPSDDGEAFDAAIRAGELIWNHKLSARAIAFEGFKAGRASAVAPAPSPASQPVAPADKEISGAEMHDVVHQLREYASNPGYSHNDYADTMCQAANCIESLRAMFWNCAVAPSDAKGKADAANAGGLLPCAFCGDVEPVLMPNEGPQGIGRSIGHPHTDTHYVHCDNCGADGPAHLTEYEARSAWDSRATQSPATSTADAIGVAVEWPNGSVDFVRGRPKPEALTHWVDSGATVRALAYVTSAADAKDAALEVTTEMYWAAEAVLEQFHVIDHGNCGADNHRGIVAAIRAAMAAAPSSEKGGAK